MRMYLIASLLVLSIAFPLIGACRRDNESSGSKATSSKGGDADRCPHEIRKDKCPFCTPDLVASQGFCGEHGVAEALCYQCRPFLKTTFRAKQDWCKTHDAPDSQCVSCHPELKDRAKPGSGHGQAHPTPPGSSGCTHGIEPAKCPFCKPEIIESDGFCAGHDIAEALCVKCRPFLETAFKAAGDWCGEHAVPESQCADCNPDLKEKKEKKTP